MVDRVAFSLEINDTCTTERKFRLEYVRPTLTFLNFNIQSDIYIPRNIFYNMEQDSRRACNLKFLAREAQT